jgi:hypothetical protein
VELIRDSIVKMLLPPPRTAHRAELRRSGVRGERRGMAGTLRTTPHFDILHRI